VDRNCHKSVNHELTVTQVNPVYFQPARNGLGIIGLVPLDQFAPETSTQKNTHSFPVSKAPEQDLVYAIITNCTCDGLIYDVYTITATFSGIKFGEAWYAYPAFHALYQGRFVTGIRKTGIIVRIYAIQPTYKMLAVLSSASMINIRSNERAPVDYDNTPPPNLTALSDSVPYSAARIFRLAIQRCML